MVEQAGLRATKKRQTRARIEAAALDLIERDGFDATTVEAIAAAAGIAPRTFFYYFPTKQDAVLADYASRLERIVGEVDGRPAHERAWTALRAAFVTVAADYDAERDQLIRRFRVMAATPSVAARSLQLHAGWEDAVATALARRAAVEPDSDLPSRLLASAALAAMRSALSHWIATGQHTRLPDLVAACFGRLGAGLDTA
jgi:AcrR family transcriptional regulator